MNPIAAKIEAFLFSEGGPIQNGKLAKFAGIAEKDLPKALGELEKALEETGLALVRSETETSLAISANSADFVRAAQENELSGDIGDSGLEVLAIVLYRGPSTRAQIDYIRGVNTSSTIRSLLARGLLERAGNPLDGREYLYRPTVELLAHLGAKKAEVLPEYVTISSEIAAFENKAEPFTKHASR